MPQTAWVSQFQFEFQLQFQLQLESVGRQYASVRISLQTGGSWLSVTHGWAAQPECKRSAAMVRRTLGQYVAVCPRLQLTSHTQPTSTLSRIKCEGYVFYKEVCPFVHWNLSLFLTMFLHVLCIYMWLDNILDED